jgi:hypothetical protein
MNITKEYLHQLFDYNEGQLYWKVDRGTNKMKGKRAGCLYKGYIRIRLHDVKYGEHQLVWLYHHGEMPQQIDHINNDGRDNRIENLRIATPLQNNQNATIRKDNTTGIKGVCKGYKDKWQVHVRINGKKHYFGSYDDIEFAELVAIEARNKYHGIFANHG